MSNSVIFSGGAILFFITLALTLIPIASPDLSFMSSYLRKSTRTEAAYFKAIPPGVVSGLPNIIPILLLS